MDSPFAVLGLDSDADGEEIKRAYRERVKESHPDHGGSVEEFRAVRAAYEQLEGGRRETGEWLATDPTPDVTEDGNRSQGRGQSQSRGQSRESGQSQENHQSRESEDRPQHSQVTYLNYDVLTDYGWETTDENLFEKAASADLDETDYGEFRAEPGESLLEAAESRGFAWPFACRGGACANCAIILSEGELSMPGNHVLPAEMMDRNIRLSCNGTPVSDDLKVIYNVKHMPELEDLLLPPRPFKQAYPGD